MAREVVTLSPGFPQPPGTPAELLKAGKASIRPGWRLRRGCWAPTAGKTGAVSPGAQPRPLSHTGDVTPRAAPGRTTPEPWILSLRRSRESSSFSSRERSPQAPERLPPPQPRRGEPPNRPPAPRGSGAGTAPAGTCLPPGPCLPPPCPGHGHHPPGCCTQVRAPGCPPPAVTSCFN